MQAVLDEGYGLGPLQPYVDDPAVENININGPRRVWLELRGGGKHDAGPIATDDAELVDMVRRWGRRPGQNRREFSSSRPMMTAAIGPGIRLSAVMAVTRTVHVSVRCHRQLAVSLDELAGAAYQTLTPDLAAFVAPRCLCHPRGVTGANQHYLPAVLIGGFGRLPAGSGPLREAEVAVRDRATGVVDSQLRRAKTLAARPGMYRLTAPPAGVDSDIVDTLWNPVENALRDHRLGAAQ